MMLHAAHTAHSGYNKIPICTVRHRCCLAVALVHLDEDDEVWVSLGIGNAF